MKNRIEGAEKLASRARQSFPGKVLQKAQEDNLSSQSVLIAWSGLQTMFPIVLVLAAILGLVLGIVGVDSKRIYDTVAAAIPDPAGQQQVLDALRGVKTQTGLFAILATVGFLWSASSLFGTLEQAFDVMFHVPKRNFLKQKLMSVLMMLIFTLLAGLAVVSSALLPLVGRLPGLSAMQLTHAPASVIIQFVIGSVAGFLLYFAIYYVVPNRKQEVRQVWPGALVAGVGFELLTLVFPVYLHFAGGGMNQYGKTFALLFILLAFFYFVGLLTMLGMEINTVLYPVPIPQPDRVDALSPAARGGGEPSQEAGTRQEKAEAPRSRDSQAAARRLYAEPGRRGEGHPEARPGEPRGRLKRALFAALGTAIGLLSHKRRGRATG